MSIQPWTEQPQGTVHSAAQDLIEWAQGADAAYSLAQKLVASSFCPEQFRGKPVDAAAAILSGAEVGLSPMSALRAFDVIQGTAAARAITLRAIVQSKGHEVEVVESTNTRCRMRGRRRGSSDWQAVSWTIERAQQLGVTGKSNWKNQPQAMLIARATSEVCRLIASDAILGIAYSSEEVADGGTGENAREITAPTVTPTRTMSRKPKSEPDPEPTPQTGDGAPPPSDHPDAAGEVEDAPPPPQPRPGTEPTAAKRAKMFASFRDAGFTSDPKSESGRRNRLAYIAHAIGREVESSNELSSNEVGVVIAMLEADAQNADEPGEAS